ncbi:MAG: phospholipase D-like domain-containing protein [Candidatus Odinarchaeota archaeon]
MNIIRKRNENGKLSVHAIAGNYVVLLGINAEEEITDKLLGFAIYRIDHTENEEYYLKGFKTFKEVEPNPQPGSLVSTLEHPVQAFLWGDYTAKPAHSYTYKMESMYDDPRDLRQGDTVEITIDTENVDLGEHAVFFNRGQTASQAYAWKFGNRKPEDVPNREAYKWLSRGLEEGILGFISKAKDKDYGLRAAVYEFSHLPVLKAFREANERGVDVKIIYDSKKNKNHVKTSDEAIEKAGIRDLMERRKGAKSYIAHNKFIVLMRNGLPIEVWTGSANFTESGIFGQSNVGHIVRNESIAKIYLEYWKELFDDPEAKELREWVVPNTPVPTSLPVNEMIIPIFSPRRKITALEYYAQLMDNAKETVCFTAAFGVNKKLAKVFAKDKPYLRYILLERPGNNIDMVKRDIDNRVAIGATIGTGTADRWMDEITGLGVHVRYVHTKYLLIEPLSNKPIVITGSANFSDASVKKNDENMIVIYYNTKVADIYLGEFMRLFNHYYFRYIRKSQEAAPETTEREPAYLASDNSWCVPYYEEGSIKEKERLLFG